MPRMTSTSVITGTGFMKCMPMTLSGRFVAAAIFVIEIDDVFEARMHSAPVMRSSFAKSSRLRREVLDDRLDDDVGVAATSARSVVSCDAAEDRPALLGGHLSLVDAAPQILTICATCALQEGLGRRR